MRRVLAMVLFGVLAVGLSSARSAEPATSSGESKGSASKPEAATSAAPADNAVELSEEDILAFAREHHPELADLLANLKQTNAKEYQKALRQLNQARQRLSRIRRTSPEKYELALTGWKLDSRIRLLAARMTMSDDPALEEQLKQLLRERQEVRVKELANEKEQLNERLGKVEKLMQKMETEREKSLQNELDRIKRGLGKGAAKNGNPKKGPAKPAKEAAKETSSTPEAK